MVCISQPLCEPRRPSGKFDRSQLPRRFSVDPPLLPLSSRAKRLRPSTPQPWLIRVLILIRGGTAEVALLGEAISVPTQPYALLGTAHDQVMGLAVKAPVADRRVEADRVAVEDERPGHIEGEPAKRGPSWYWAEPAFRQESCEARRGIL